ncbi:MAG: HXXEE domain-containing protein [Bacteroidetes bacterium]|nr:HXXEE domain-containing protein [Bacteroidota bacterium]
MERKARPAWIAIIILFVIHNLEEIVFDLPEWGREHIAFLSDLSVGRFGFALVVALLVLIVSAIAWMYRSDAQRTRRLKMLFLSIMIVVFLWHIGVSLATHSIQPGVVTAAAFLPIHIIWWRRCRSLDGNS